jgi:hypothetical protein
MVRMIKRKKKRSLRILRKKTRMRKRRKIKLKISIRLRKIKHLTWLRNFNSLQKPLIYRKLKKIS